MDNQRHQPSRETGVKLAKELIQQADRAWTEAGSPPGLERQAITLSAVDRLLERTSLDTSDYGPRVRPGAGPHALAEGRRLADALIEFAQELEVESADHAETVRAEEVIVGAATYLAKRTRPWRVSPLDRQISTRGDLN